MKPKVKLSTEAKEIITQLRINNGYYITKRLDFKNRPHWALFNNKFMIIRTYKESAGTEAINTTFLKRCENGYCFNQQ